MQTIYDINCYKLGLCHILQCLRYESTPPCVWIGEDTSSIEEHNGDKWLVTCKIVCGCINLYTYTNSMWAIHQAIHQASYYYYMCLRWQEDQVTAHTTSDMTLKWDIKTFSAPTHMARTHMYMQACRHACTPTHTHTHMHVYTHTHTHTHTHKKKTKKKQKKNKGV